MQRVEVEQARLRLSELIEDALGGADVVITQDRQPLVRLVKAAAPKPGSVASAPPKGSSRYATISRNRSQTFSRVRPSPREIVRR